MREIRKLKFPSYSFLKSLSTENSYDWVLFELPIPVEGVLMYNLDNSGMIWFTIFEGGFSTFNDFNLELPLKRRNYKVLRRHVQKTFETFCKSLDKDMSETWGIEESEMEYAN